MSSLTTVTLSKSRRVSAKIGTKRWSISKAKDLCCTLSQKFCQGTNPWPDFDDINLVINLSRIHDFLKDIGIRQEILPEGLF